MAPVTVTVEIERSAKEVFAYATDPTRFQEWQQGVVDGRMDQTGAPAVGARCFTTRRIGFANRTSTSELVRIDAPTSWSVRGVDGPIRAIVDVTVQPVAADRSRLTISVDFTGHGMGKVLVPLTAKADPAEWPTIAGGSGHMCLRIAAMRWAWPARSAAGGFAGRLRPGSSTTATSNRSDRASIKGRQEVLLSPNAGRHPALGLRLVDTPHSYE